MVTVWNLMMDVTMVVCINEAVIVLGVDKLVLDNKIVVPDLMQLNDTCPALREAGPVLY